MALRSLGGPASRKEEGKHEGTMTLKIKICWDVGKCGYRDLSDRLLGEETV